MRDPIREELEKKLLQTEQELSNRIVNNPYNEEPVSMKTILILLGVVVLLGLGYVAVMGGS